ncbi:calcium-translocating P-type ATPase, PMCA-type [bacterium 3DAC]|nr:calcium-translocating P-type ATPase, PMCA-type [bacterium 3DAC]
MEKWHAMTREEVIKKFGVDPEKGLSIEEARKRLEKYGRNVLPEGKKKTLWDRLAEQLLDPMIILLMVASVISIFVGEWVDAIAIIVIVVLNAIIGIYQEYKAESALEALKTLTTPHTRVIRDGAIIEITVDEIVPGDIVVLEAGDKVPADIYILEAFGLMVDESILTGESHPVMKVPGTVGEDTALADRKNMLYMGTSVVKGRAKGIVVATGPATELGKIATSLASMEEEKTPLQKKMAEFSKKLSVITLGIVAIVFALGLYRAWGSGSNMFQTILDQFMVAVSLAVAAVPEGLPAVMTLVLAIGVMEMAAENAIVKKLAAVETLGSTTHICTDKTGTLTQNEMTVRYVRTPSGGCHKVKGEGYSPEGDIENANVPEMEWILKISALCNDSHLRKDENGVYSIVGDPTEGALVVLAYKGGLDVQSLREECPRVGEIPFDSDRKMMTTIHKCDGKYYAMSKGAVESILAVSSYIQVGEEVRPITEEDRKKIIETANSMASQALRVLAFAYKEMAEPDEDTAEKDLIFVGLVGMIDPPRPEVPGAIKMCKTAGIKVAMVTGDNPITAMAIAKEIGLVEDHEEGTYITGAELERMTDEELRKIVKDTKVFARVSPEHKLRIVKALKYHNEIVAMTGDGVNDAPALKMADIGVSMGLRGTEVAKEAADLILLDDNFATITKAVRRGRIIYDNIRKFVQFLLSCNLGEVAIVFLAELFGWGSPFRPIHLLFLNLLTDSFPALALGMEGPEKDVMERPPRDPNEPLLDRKMTFLMGATATFITVAVLSVYYLVKYVWQFPHDVAQTAALATLVIAEVVRGFAARSEKEWILFTPKMFTNKYMNWAVFISIALLLLAMYLPGIDRVMQLNPVKDIRLLTTIVIASLLPALALEVAKVWYGRRYES